MAVSQWKTKGIVPSSRVLQVFNATGVTPVNYVLIYIRIRRMEYLRVTMQTTSFENHTPVMSMQLKTENQFLPVSA
jgi:hypothetical protein